MDGEKRFRVYNRCKYDIGVTLLSGQKPCIKAGGFIVLTVNDILYVESICQVRKFFSAKMLVPVTDDGRDVSIEELGGYTDEYSLPHMNDDEISAMLKKSNKAMEAWLQTIDDAEELHSIYDVAKRLDLPASKLRILNAKMPEKEWLEEEE